MPVPAIAAIGMFVLLFVAWVILPSRLKKQHANKAGSSSDTEE
jgi:hypothetical protein